MIKSVPVTAARCLLGFKDLIAAGAAPAVQADIPDAGKYRHRLAAERTKKIDRAMLVLVEHLVKTVRHPINHRPAAAPARQKANPELGSCGAVTDFEHKTGRGAIDPVASPYGRVAAFLHDAGRVPVGIHQRFELLDVGFGKIEENEILVHLRRID